MLDTTSSFFFFNEIPSPSCTQPTQQYGRCVSDRQVHVQASGSNVHLAGPGGGVKAAVNFACERRRLTIIFNEDEYCFEKMSDVATFSAYFVRCSHFGYI